MTPKFIPISNVSLKITYAGNVKKKFYVLFYNIPFRAVIGLLFPTTDDEHENEIPEFKTLSQVIDGAEEWEWNFFGEGDD